MRRLLHILLNVATLLSFLLFVGAVAGWVRSQWALDGLVYRRIVGPLDDLRMRKFSLFGTRRSLVVGVSGYRFQPEDADEAAVQRRKLLSTAGFNHIRWDPRPLEDFFDDAPRGGFAFQTDPTYAAMPWWTLALLFAVAPALAVWRRWRLRAVAPGLCPACGYDVRATPSRCPECGAIPRRRR